MEQSAMRRIFFSLLLIGASAALVPAATSASFSDTASRDGNTFTRGTLFLSLDASCGPAPDAQSRSSGATSCSDGASFTAPNINPGEAAIMKAIVVRNAGSIGGTLTTTQTVTYS